MAKVAIFTRLESGDWGIVCFGPARVGELLWVRVKDGLAVQRRVGAVLEVTARSTLCSILNVRRPWDGPDYEDSEGEMTPRDFLDRAP